MASVVAPTKQSAHRLLLTASDSTYSPELAMVPAHPDALVFPTLTAHAAVHVRGIGAMLEIVPAGCRQGCLQCCRPLRVGLGEAPDLVGGKPEVADDGTERLASVDRIQEVLAHVGRESLLRSRSFAIAGNIAVPPCGGWRSCSRRSTVPSCRAVPLLYSTQVTLSS
jgi:hypothetical protein